MVRSQSGSLALVLTLAFVGCRNPPGTQSPSAHLTPGAPASQAAGGLHNVLPLTPKVTSGSVPQTDADFAELKAMGIRTIISVDGATPDVERAHRYALRYVHLPIGYDGMTPQRRMELARAIRDLPGPIYLHCHHGMHRGPAAAAAAAITLGELTPEQGIAFLQTAGTSPNYRGLYAVVRTAVVASPDQLNATCCDFPEIAPIPGFVAAMAEAQEVYDRLALIRDAGWCTPAEHPDLVPLAEAGRLEGLLRAMLDDPETAEHPAGFAAHLAEARELAQELEDGLSIHAPQPELTAGLAQIGRSCKECHTQYRDNR